MALPAWFRKLFGSATPKTIQSGSRGSAVKAWQEWAMKHDGVFGPITELVTKHIQSSHGLEPTGVVDEMTWKIANDKLPPVVVVTGQEGESVGDWYLFGGTSRTTNAFRYALWQMAERLQGDVNAYAAIMDLESGLNPAATNPTGGATGLIQFMPNTAQRLGTSTDALRSMSGIEQLKYVEKFYSGAKGVTDPGTLYMLTFLPAYAHKADSFVLGVEGSGESLSGLNMGKIYAQNKGLDTNKDAIITVGEVKNLARGRYGRAKDKGSIPITPEAPPASSSGGGGGVVVIALLGAAAYAGYKVFS